MLQLFGVYNLCQMSLFSVLLLCRVLSRHVAQVFIYYYDYRYVYLFLKKTFLPPLSPANGEILDLSGLRFATLNALIVFCIILGFVTVHRGSMINTADLYSGSPGSEYWHRTGRTDLDLSRTCSERQISAET